MNSDYGKVLLMVVCSTLLVSVTGAPNACGKMDLKTDPFGCCALPKLLDVTVVGTCYEKYPIDKEAAEKGIRTECMSECILNSTGIYNRRGDVDDKKLHSVFIDSLPENSPWLSPVRKAIKQCSTKANKQNKEFDKDVAEQKKTVAKGTQVCNPEASFLVDCIHTTVFSDCPSSLRSTTAECEAIWNFLKACPFSALRQ
ncbi:uncharacterized protein LOC128304225 [Anopheles moucheti]|uniref:uncharacterized protein LOC128304225 n=1 Tax=Anopheles moucheti TaxID=186751 RepID=UPI0022F0A991|nr:uncharacterized protein LOC128304225 [Anopheles moucheti]